MATRPTWDEYFMKIAEVVSERSCDPATNHGCVIVDTSNRILSTGYNGPVRGMNDDLVPRTRPEKYDWYIHAEDNACLFARASLDRATVYVTGYPCSACFRRLAQAGVRRIVYGHRFSQCVSIEERLACSQMAAQLGVAVEAFVTPV